MPDWMKFLNQSGMEKQMEQLFSMLSPEQLGGLINQQFKSNQAPEEPSSLQSNLSVEILETHDYLFIRIPIKEDQLANLKVYHTSTKFLLSGLPPEPAEKQSFHLPAPVKKKGAKSSYRDEILEIILFKVNESHYSEISIPEW
jgi:HSP20 family molecular chaperone IbpA